MLVGKDRPDVSKAFDAENVLPCHGSSAPMAPCTPRSTAFTARNGSTSRFRSCSSPPWPLSPRMNHVRRPSSRRRLACGCQVGFRPGVEGSPVAVVLDRKAPGCSMSMHVAGLPVHDHREALRPSTRFAPSVHIRLRRKLSWRSVACSSTHPAKRRPAPRRRRGGRLVAAQFVPVTRTNPPVESDMPAPRPAVDARASAAPATTATRTRPSGPGTRAWRRCPGSWPTTSTRGGST